MSVPVFRQQNAFKFLWLDLLANVNSVDEVLQSQGRRSEGGPPYICGL